jgi:hypothetical protein
MSYYDGVLLVRVGQRPSAWSPSKLLVCAGREALVVPVKVVKGYGILQKKLTRTGTASEDD